MNEITQDTSIELSKDFPELKISFNKRTPNADNYKVTCPDDAYQAFMKIWDIETINYREEFLILCLDSSKAILGWSKISVGGRSATVVEPSSVFQVALLANANSIILAHNHPSERLKASAADVSLTKRLTEIGKLHSIVVDDHLIITKYDFLSLKEEKLL